MIIFIADSLFCSSDLISLTQEIESSGFSRCLVFGGSPVSDGPGGMKCYQGGEGKCESGSLVDNFFSAYKNLDGVRGVVACFGLDNIFHDDWNSNYKDAVSTLGQYCKSFGVPAAAIKLPSVSDLTYIQEAKRIYYNLISANGVDFVHPRKDDILYFFDIMKK
ncbi:MAG: hypothetical protein ACRC2O_06670 [Chitinophagaceae bacterium]